jgi:hypothetical protein
VRTAHKQLQPEFIFQGLNAAAECGLAEMAQRSSTPEVAAVGQCDQMLDALDVHDMSPSIFKNAINA